MGPEVRLNLELSTSALCTSTTFAFFNFSGLTKLRNLSNVGARDDDDDDPKGKYSALQSGVRQGSQGRGRISMGEDIVSGDHVAT